MASVTITPTVIGAASDVLVILYRADRGDIPSIGVEITRQTITTGVPTVIDVGSYTGHVLGIALTPTDTIKFDAEVRDWLVPVEA